MKTDTLIERTKGEWKVISNHPVFDNKNIIAVRDDENCTSFRDKYKMICEITEIHGDSFTRLEQGEAEANAAFICKAVNNYDSLLDIAKRCEFIFGNEANYPEGTIGYRLCQDAKKVINNL